MPMPENEETWKNLQIIFATKNGNLEHVWATSWGVSTRLIGALIMTHSDDNGLVLPPNLAPYQVVIVPIYRGEEQRNEVSKVAEKIKSELISNNIRVKFDNRDNFKPGFKFNEYELKGVPLRIAIGPKDKPKNYYPEIAVINKQTIIIKPHIIETKN